MLLIFLIVFYTVLGQPGAVLPEEFREEFDRIDSPEAFFRFFHRYCESFAISAQKDERIGTLARQNECIKAIHGISEGTIPANFFPAKPFPASSFPTNSLPAKAFPAKPFPENTLPVKPFPTKPFPAKPFPENTFLAKPFPANSFPAKPFPANSSPAKPFPTKPFPAKPFPENTFPAKPFPENTFPAKPFPENTLPAKPFPANTFLAKPFPANSFPAKPFPANSSPAKPFLTKPFPAKPFPENTFPAKPFPANYFPASSNPQIIHIAGTTPARPILSEAPLTKSIAKSAVPTNSTLAKAIHEKSFLIEPTLVKARLAEFIRTAPQRRLAPKTYSSQDPIEPIKTYSEEFYLSPYPLTYRSQLEISNAAWGKRYLFALYTGHLLLSTSWEKAKKYEPKRLKFRFDKHMYLMGKRPDSNHWEYFYTDMTKRRRSAIQLNSSGFDKIHMYLGPATSSCHFKFKMPPQNVKHSAPLIYKKSRRFIFCFYETDLYYSVLRQSTAPGCNSYLLRMDIPETNGE